jgi:hypothetical protein
LLSFHIFDFGHVGPACRFSRRTLLRGTVATANNILAACAATELMRT